MTEDPRKKTIEFVSKIIDKSGISDSKADELKDSLNLMATCPCYGDNQIPEKKKKKNVRSEFMGNCMRSTVKGGEGKDMKTCSDNWKEKKKDAEVKTE